MKSERQEPKLNTKKENQHLSIHPSIHVMSIQIDIRQQHNV